ncbi:hypothetical protein CGCSCA5_v001637 [Colletotrichum siamense]|nr:hypothetical protein CGCSCA5_v001637 [Colletotrichum siamense]
MLFDTLLQGRFPRTTELLKRWTSSKRIGGPLRSPPGGSSSRSRRHSDVADEALERRHSQYHRQTQRCSSFGIRTCVKFLTASCPETFVGSVTANRNYRSPHFPGAKPDSAGRS